MDRDALVERMAEAAYSAGIAPWPWAEMSEGGKTVWRIMLDAALAIAEEAVREDCVDVVEYHGGDTADAVILAIRARSPAHTPRNPRDD